MQLETLKYFLGLCSLLNIAFLFIWLFMFKLTGEFQYKTINYFYELDEKEFSVLNLTLMAYYKLGTFMFFIIPYIGFLFV